MELDILKIASDTKYEKKLHNYTHSALKKNPLCGDFIELKINIIITDLTIISARKNKLIKEKSVLLAKPKLCVAISASIQSFLIKICH